MANLLPHIELHFPGKDKVLARLFFRTTMDTVQFKTKSIGPLAVSPISFIYMGNIYWQRGKPFLFNNEVNEFSPKEIYCLEWIAFKLLYQEILTAANIIESNPGEAAGNSQMENKIIDKLDLPALENSLNEAVRIENYEAAAHIRDKIKMIQDSKIKKK